MRMTTQVGRQGGDRGSGPSSYGSNGPGRVSLRALAELIRAPAALTVPGDSIAGAAAAGWPFGLATPALGVSSACIYWAGMALNDYADRDVDAIERPERPIPSGRVPPGMALGVAAGLTAAGLGIAGIAGGRRALAVAVPLAATAWAYDLFLKSTPAGPVAMAAARGLDVLLGAGAGRLRPAAPAALAVGVHTLGITLLSRGEVRGASPATVGAALGLTTAATALAAPPDALARGVSTMKPPHRGRHATSRRTAGAVLGLGLLGGYAASAGGAQIAAARDPGARQVRRAVGAGIHGLIPLQAALIARAGAPTAAAAVAAAFPLARRLSRKVSPT
jgi:hypothetical protein